MEKILSGIMALALVGVVGITATTMAPANKPLTEEKLPTVGTIENLEKLLEESNKLNNRNGIVYDMSAPTLEMADSAGSMNKTSQEVATTHSETNIQVAGVDESDVVKTDGKYIYQVNSSKIVIAKAYPANEMEVVKEIKYPTDVDNSFRPREMYVDDNYLIVIGNTYKYEKNEVNANAKMMYYYPRGNYYAAALIYDLSNYELVRSVEVEGNYISSRKVGSSVYLVSNKYVYSYGNDDGVVLPAYRDTCKNNEYQTVDVAKMCYFPGFVESSYLLIAGFDLDQMNKEATISSYLGAGSEIYATSETLYVTQTNYKWSNNGVIPQLIDSVGIMEDTISKTKDETTTTIYKFNIAYGEVKYKAKGEVTGTVLNQFAMDEYKGNFRIATTIGNTWDDTSKNNLYILDENMNTVGKVEGLAKGEKIYSVRFMGEKAYIVTYKNVDPLFVIDVADPKNPKVLGELKIPGYSDYLQPYKENYLIGFGKDTVVKTYKNWNGDMEENAYEVGLKIALFDVSDFNNPKEVHSIKVGDRGSYSELSYNHKALLFDEEKDIFAFPATVTESKGTDSRGVPNYGETVFTGALVYSLDLEDGFNLKTKISHSNKKYDYDSQVQRILYIGNVLYTISQETLMANDINTFEKLNEIDLNPERVYDYKVMPLVN